MERNDSAYQNKRMDQMRAQLQLMKAQVDMMRAQCLHNDEILMARVGLSPTFDLWSHDQRVELVQALDRHEGAGLAAALKRFGYVKCNRTKYRHMYDSSYPTIDLRPGTDIFAEWPRQLLVQAYLYDVILYKQQIKQKCHLTKLVNGTYTRTRKNAADPAERMAEVAAKRRELEKEEKEAVKSEESEDEYALGGF